MQKNSCAKCGNEATRKLEIESEVGSVWLCGSNECRETLIKELRSTDFPHNHQGRHKGQVEYAEKVGAISTILVILFVLGYVISLLFR
jgi:hypothetical protein